MKTTAASFPQTATIELTGKVPACFVETATNIST